MEWQYFRSRTEPFLHSRAHVVQGAGVVGRRLNHCPHDMHISMHGHTTMNARARTYPYLDPESHDRSSETYQAGAFLMSRTNLRRTSTVDVTDVCEGTCERDTREDEDDNGEPSRR